MKKISLIAMLGVMCVAAANADTTDTVDMRETMVTVDQINGDVPAPANADPVAIVATTTTTTTTNWPAVTDTIITVQQAKTLPDETVLVLRGNIIESLGDEKYTFQDDTDSITVEIDDDEWNGFVVGPTDTVIIWGEVDSGLFSTEIDVSRIQVVQ